MLTATNQRIAFDIGSSSLKGYNLLTKEYFEGDNCILAVPSDNNRLAEDFVTDSKDIRDIRKNLDLRIRKVEGSLKGTKLESRYLVGNIARQYSPHCVKPNSLLGKSEQQTTYVNVLANVAVEMVESGINYSQPKIGCLLPPVEAYGEEKDIFLETLCGTYEIESVLQGKRVTLEIIPDKLHIQAEGFSSFAVFIFDGNGNMTEEAAKYKDGRILGCDIGASSTDLSVIDKLRPVKRTFETIRMGGNKIAGLLTAEISKSYRGYKPTVDEVEEAVKTAKINIGAQTQDLSAQLIKAKNNFADMFYAQFLSYLERQDIHPNSLSGIMFVGGGALPCGSIPSVGEYIHDRIKSVCPYVEAIYPENPRMSNLNGLVRYMNSLEQE